MTSGAFRGRGINVVTNKPAGQPYRGVARPISCVGHEMVMDALAWELGKDPAEVRASIMVKPEQMPYTSVTRKQLDSGDYPRALRRALELHRQRRRARAPAPRRAGWQADRRRHRLPSMNRPPMARDRIGYSSWGIELVPGLEPAVARLTGDGELVLEVGSHSHGQGHETIYAQIAHEVLGIDPRRVTVRHGDTYTSPVGTGTYSSRSR